MINAEILNTNLQRAIKDKLPQGVNIANFLKDILFIGKEAVYRRLRGEVSFTLYEAAIIANKIGISLDLIIKENDSYSDHLFFELKPLRFNNLRQKDYDMLYEYRDLLRYVSQENNSEMVITSNGFPQFPTHHYYLLGKYSSFRWSYLNQNSEELKAFHEIEYPDKLSLVMKEIVEATMDIKNTCYIWDNVVFYSIVKEIKYFHGIRLINDEDIIHLKNELLSLLDFLEGIAVKGRFETGNKLQIYISNIHTDTSYSYLETDHLKLSMMGAFALNYVVSLEAKNLQKIKERILSMKRVSVLISESGEMQRIQFFKAQREIVESLSIF